MGRFEPADPRDFVKTPPYAELLSHLQQSADYQEHLGWVNAYLVPSASTERLATAEADAAEEAVYAIRAILEEASAVVTALEKLHLTNSEEAGRACALHDDIYRSHVSARNARMEAVEASWRRWGDEY